MDEQPLGEQHWTVVKNKKSERRDNSTTTQYALRSTGSISDESARADMLHKREIDRPSGWLT